MKCSPKPRAAAVRCINRQAPRGVAVAEWASTGNQLQIGRLNGKVINGRMAARTVYGRQEWGYLVVIGTVMGQ